MGSISALAELAAELALQLLVGYKVYRPGADTNKFLTGIPLLKGLTATIQKLNEAFLQAQKEQWKDDDPRWAPLEAEGRAQLQAAQDRLT